MVLEFRVNHWESCLGGVHDDALTDALPFPGFRV